MEIAIIGAGASGLVAAIKGAKAGFSVSIYERNDRCGKKLLATGNGQCNIDNINVSADNYFGKNKNFVHKTLASFTTKDNMDFWQSIGVSLIVKENGKVYPRSLQASSVLDMLRINCEILGVKEINKCEIIEIIKQKKGFMLKDSNKQTYFADIVIVACGGSAAANLGGCDGGYKLLKNLGHTLNNPLPAIVQLKTQNALKALSGQKINAEATLLVQNKVVRMESGEVLFTDYGLSGVPILQISAQASFALSKHKEVGVKLDILPDYSLEELENFLINRFKLLENVPLSEALTSFLAKRIAQQYIKEALNVQLSLLCKDVSIKQIKALAYLLKNKVYSITDTAGLKNAQATLGGIDTLEFDNVTMQSKKVAGVYAIGEVLDICGDCGGFNLHWATSSACMCIKYITK